MERSRSLLHTKHNDQRGNSIKTTIVSNDNQRRIKPASERDLSIDYLHTTLTLMVVAHHSSLAYTTFANFDKENPLNSTAPIVDTTRWAFLDYAENFNDVFFMSLIFFVSGLFIHGAIQRHGTFGFIRDGFLRLGLLFAFTVVVLMPIAFYASWQLTGMSRGLINFYQILARHGFIAGPPWFIWVLLVFDVLLALIVSPLNWWMPSIE